MNQPFRIVLLTALAGLTLAARPAEARPPVPMSHPAPGQRLKWDSKKFMHVSELRPGMRGYALTVFKGTTISKFGIEILGVMSKFNEGKDYIMFRVTDGPPVTRGLGIAHGMSGSPIYVNGRLVGAISLGNEFAKDPIGFATPIESMFDAWSPDLPAHPSNISASPPSGMAAEAGQRQNFGTLSLPLMVSGMNALGISRLQSALAPFHFNVMAGGGSGSSAATNPLAKGATLVPGSAVGVSLVQGDIDLTATGTVTYRDGNRLLLFGHPFTSLGPIDAALTTAYVVDIYPSYQASVKFGSPIKTVGRIFQDRPFSVGGVIGPMPEMVPMTVAIDDQSIHRQKTYHVRILNHPLLTGQFVTQVADSAIEQVHGQPGDSIATVTMDVDVEEIGHVKRTNTFYDAISIDQAAVADIDSLMHLLSSNSFYPLAVKSVKMGVTIQNRHDTAEIDHLFIKQSHFAPGDTVDVGVVLKPYKRPLYTRMVSVKIPLGTTDGSLPISVRGGGSEGGTTSLLGGLIQLRAPESTGPVANIGQLVKQFEDKPRNNELVARLTLPTSAISVKGEKLSNLPPTLAQVMQSSHSTGLRTERDEVKVTQTVPYIVTGSQTITVTVRRKDTSEASHPAFSSSGSSSSPGSSGPDMPSSGSNSSSPSPLSTSDEGDDETMLSPSAAQLLQAPKPAPHPPVTGGVSPPAPNNGGAGTEALPSASSVPAPPLLGAGGDTSIKPVGRLPQVWRQGTMGDFAAGTLKNAAVTSLGDVRLAPSLQKLADTTENYIWAILPDGKGNLYLGTGDGGAIYKMDAAGKVTPFFQTKELEVTSLALDGKGGLYAGTAPNGRVFWIGADGKGSKVFTAKEKYITALAMGTDALYIATGGGTGRIYRLLQQAIRGLNLVSDTASSMQFKSREDAYYSEVLFTSPEAHLLSLAVDKEGNIYAGSAPDGIVYKIVPVIGRNINVLMPSTMPTSSVFYDAAESGIAALATDSQGNVYAGTTGSGTVYRIAPDGTAKRLLGRAVGIMSLKTDASDAVYAVTGSTVYKINSDDTVQSYVAQADEQFLSLAVDPIGNAVYAGTGTVGSVYKIGEPTGNTLQGTFQSTVHDAGVRSRWGTLAWTANTPVGTSVRLETRSGDVERPDDSWSAWSAPATNGSGQAIASPPARYIQYQALLTGDAASVASGAVPRLRDVSLYYLTRNRPPTVSLVKPAGGDALFKAALIQWNGSDPDKDTLSYDVFYSGDNGKTWTPIKKRATPNGSHTGKSAAARTAESKANLAKQGDLPPAVRAHIMAQVASVDASDTSKTAQALKETSFSWDTTEVPDGTYQVQVIASDKPSNPDGSLTAKATSAPFLIANTKPTLTLGTPVVNADKTVTLHGTAQTGLAFVKAVQGKADSGDPIAAQADDGLFDSPTETFTLTLPTLTSGSHTIEVQVLDRAGNSVTQTVKVSVP